MKMHAPPSRGGVYFLDTLARTRKKKKCEELALKMLIRMMKARQSPLALPLRILVSPRVHVQLCAYFLSAIKL